jgi:general secretion pathway protein G
MRTYRSTRKSGFTLVEILIVVIILGILAAIVIPQFTNASQDARKNSLTSQLQTIRSQLELFKLQHKDQLPTSLGTGTNDWAEMTTQTDADQAAYTASSTTGPFGPYLQQPPANSLNTFSAVGTTTTDLGTGGVANPASGSIGWVVNLTTGKIWATSAKLANVYDESDPNNPDNDL